MRHSVVKILVVMAVVLGMVQGGSCAVLAAVAGKTPCQKSTSPGDGIHNAAGATCHAKPCQGQKDRLFILSDTSPRRPAAERPIDSPVPGAPLAKTAAPLVCVIRGAPDLLERPPSFVPPPLYCLHCSLIC